MRPRPLKAALIIMAKAPEAGLAKTRLIPALGPEGAARLAARLLRHTVQIAMRTKTFSYRELCVTPHAHHPAFNELRSWGPEQGITLTEQHDGDLGARMRHAFERVLLDHDLAIMIGTDAPGLTADMLDQSVRELDQHDAVFVPALDGGYALIGIKQVLPTLFANMPWSTDAVMNLTRERLRESSLSWYEHPPVADIDEPQDLAHLPTGFAT